MLVGFLVTGKIVLLPMHSHADRLTGVTLAVLEHNLAAAASEWQEKVGIGWSKCQPSDFILFGSKARASWL